MYVPTMFGPVYVTHDRGGRQHVCPASWRLATDPEFAARVARRTAARIESTHSLRAAREEERA